MHNIYYKNATEMFEGCYHYVHSYGRRFAGTKAVFNFNFTVKNPLDRVITTPVRKFKQDYADYEWEWYLSGNRDAAEISERAKIWKNMMVPGTTEVNSNYGYFWNQNGQLDRMIEELKTNPQSRRAVLVHYDPNELDRYKYDTPCNLVLNFYVDDECIHMSVFARSIDLWYGLCNDFYTFSKLLELVSNKLGMPVGTINFSITNLHIYEKHWNKL
jgi:thymidylate synthase